MFLRIKNSFGLVFDPYFILSGKSWELFGFYFLKLFLRIVFENIKNIFLMLFEKCSCYLNLVFYVFSLFFTKKINK